VLNCQTSSDSPGQILMLFMFLLVALLWRGARLHRLSNSL
jgi:uncharacterized protein (TIGR03382 family)